MKNKLLLAGMAAGLFFSIRMSAQVPTAAFTINQATLCTGSSLEITDASSDSPITWSYTVEGAANFTSTLQNPSIPLNTPGDYTITLVAGNGFGDSAPITQTFVVKGLPPVSGGSNQAVCTGDYLTLSGSGANTYTWTGGAINGVAFPPAASAVYTVTGTDENGCASSATVAVTVNTLPVLSVSGSTAVCLGSPATLTVSGANSYTWSAGSTTDNMSDAPLLTTTYSVTGMNSVTGCTNTITRQVMVNNLPPVSVNSGSICAGKVFTMTPGGASSYVFSNGSSTVAPSGSDSFTVTGTDANGCQATAVADVTVNPLPVISVSGGTICSGSVFTLNPTGAQTFSYSPGLSATVNPATTTSYSITGTDGNGCISTIAAVAEVTVFANPAITVNSGSVCAGQVFTMTPANAASFVFSNGSNTVIPVANTSYTVTGQSANGCTADAISSVTVVALPVVTVNSGTICAGKVFTLIPQGANSYTFVNGSATVNPISNTSYSVSGSSVEGCVSAAYAVADLTVYALPQVSVTSGSVCLGSSYTITASGAASYNYQGGSATVSPLTNTSYTVTGSSVEGCASSNTAVATVSVEALPVLSITSASAICEGETATLTVSGASTYTWSVSNSSLSVYTVTPATNTTYTVSGTDANGCVNFTTQAIVVNSLPTITVNSGTICPGNSFTIIPSGASSYTFQGGSAIVTPASTTSYSVTGVDANGCLAVLPAISTVSVNNAIVLAITGNTTICEGQTTTLTASGANSYSWSATVLTNTIDVTPLITTSYTVTGMSSGCSNTTAVTVSVNALPVVTVASTSSLICMGESVTITSGGALSYSWDNGSNGSSITVSPTVNTTYTVTGTDAHSCSNKATITQTVMDCTGFAKMEAAGMNVGLYPNPSNGAFTIVVTRETTVNILNGIGQVVYSSVLVSGNNPVTLRDQPDGIYFVQLSQGDQSQVIKVVKN